jgi:DNA-binding MarR family transcriptional regulator
MARDKTRVAAEVWKQMFNFFMRGAPQRGKVLARLGLTPNDARALSALHPTVGRTMRSLSDEWGCDASNTTWIIDRLEKRGFAERRTKHGDRRVKLVLLTPNGVKARQRLVEGMYEPPPELLKLSREQLEALARILPAQSAAQPRSSRE